MINPKYITNKSGMVVLGDIHGEWSIIKSFCEKFTDFCILQVGDFGIGFKHELKESSKLRKLSDVLKQTNNQLFIIKGNHDNPKYFRGHNEYEQITFLPDYSIVGFQDTKIQVVGGGISIDRITRTINRSWWSDEEVVFYPDRIEKVDILVTHVAPTSFPFAKADVNPSCRYYHDLEKRQNSKSDLLSELDKEKNILQQISDLSECRTHYFGHYHMSNVYEQNNRRYICLNINEFREITRR